MIFRNIRERMLYNMAHFAMQRVTQAVAEHGPQLIDNFFEQRAIEQNRAAQQAQTQYPRPYFPRPIQHVHPVMRSTGMPFNPFVAQPQATSASRPSVVVAQADAVVQLDEEGHVIEGSEIPLR